MPAAIALSALRLFGRLRELLRFLLQQLVQRFFHAPAYQLPEFLLDCSLVYLYDFLGYTIGLPCVNGSRKPILSSGLRLFLAICATFCTLGDADEKLDCFTQYSLNKPYSHLDFSLQAST